MRPFGANDRLGIYVAFPLRTELPVVLQRLFGAAANGQQPLAALLSGLASRQILVLVGRLSANGPWWRLLSANGRWWRLLSADGRWWRRWLR